MDNSLITVLLERRKVVANLTFINNANESNAEIMKLSFLPTRLTQALLSTMHDVSTVKCSKSSRGCHAYAPITWSSITTSTSYILNKE